MDERCICVYMLLPEPCERKALVRGEYIYIYVTNASSTQALAADAEEWAYKFCVWEREDMLLRIVRNGARAYADRRGVDKHLHHTLSREAPNN